MNQIGFCPCYIFKKYSCIKHQLFYYRELSIKKIEHIKERIAEFGAFKEEIGSNEMICNNIQTGISLQKDDLENVKENS